MIATATAFSKARTIEKPADISELRGSIAGLSMLMSQKGRDQSIRRKQAAGGSLKAAAALGGGQKGSRAAKLEHLTATNATVRHTTKQTKESQ